MIVHVHSPTVVEVELVRASGQAQAVMELATVDVRPVAPDDLLAVRSPDPTYRGAA